MLWQLFFEEVLPAQAPAYTWPSTPSPASALLGSCLAHPNGGEHTGRALRGKASFLDVTGIDHVSDIVDGDGGFGNVRCDNDLALPSRWTFENSLLLLHRHGAMQGQNPGTFTYSSLSTELTDAVLNLSMARKEDQD